VIQIQWQTSNAEVQANAGDRTITAMALPA